MSFREDFYDWLEHECADCYGDRFNRFEWLSGYAPHPKYPSTSWPQWERGNWAHYLSAAIELVPALVLK